MKSFTKGILVGVGVGLLFAPLRGEETRRVIKERFTEWRNSLPEDSRINQYARQVSNRVEQTKGNLQNYAQQAVSKVKDTSNTLGDKTQQSMREVKQSGQDIANKTKQNIPSARSGGPSSTRVTPETNSTLSQE
ncbi:MAG TPA: YtxH domain-containing protein [Ktedonobacteraceae bacterium]|nr:YtxH domain-containing protein [Ktedonobacteraceae bacterium]